MTNSERRKKEEGSYIKKDKQKKEIMYIHKHITGYTPVLSILTAHSVSRMARSPSQGCTSHGSTHRNVATTKMPNMIEAMKHARRAGDIGVGVQMVMGVSSTVLRSASLLFRSWYSFPCPPVRVMVSSYRLYGVLQGTTLIFFTCK